MKLRGLIRKTEEFMLPDIYRKKTSKKKHYFIHPNKLVYFPISAALVYIFLQTMNFYQPKKIDDYPKTIDGLTRETMEYYRAKMGPALDADFELEPISYIETVLNSLMVNENIAHNSSEKDKEKVLSEKDEEQVKSIIKLIEEKERNRQNMTKKMNIRGRELTDEYFLNRDMKITPENTDDHASDKLFFFKSDNRYVYRVPVWTAIMALNPRNTIPTLFDKPILPFYSKIDLPTSKRDAGFGSFEVIDLVETKKTQIKETKKLPFKSLTNDVFDESGIISFEFTSDYYEKGKDIGRVLRALQNDIIRSGGNLDTLGYSGFERPMWALFQCYLPSWHFDYTSLSGAAGTLSKQIYFDEFFDFIQYNIHTYKGSPLAEFLAWASINLIDDERYALSCIETAYSIMRRCESVVTPMDSAQIELFNIAAFNIAKAAHEKRLSRRDLDKLLFGQKEEILVNIINESNDPESKTRAYAALGHEYGPNSFVNDVQVWPPADYDKSLEYYRNAIEIGVKYVPEQDAENNVSYVLMDIYRNMRMNYDEYNKSQKNIAKELMEQMAERVLE
ncbi:hypothetical protein JXA85_04815 [Candidatus Woesearchaeota archaeon]|nr:hypothetical protein [Candidatus Woesearchaeota archaeon]